MSFKKPNFGEDKVSFFICNQGGMKVNSSSFILLILLFVATFAFGQAVDVPLTEVKFRRGGDVTKSGANCYQLTEDRRWSSGAIWYPAPINLAKNFEMEVDLMLGCNDKGADGIVFIFSPELKIGYAGEGMGFAGLYPSLGVEFDTHQNHHLGDPPQDHIAVLSDGQTNHRYDLAGPIAIKQDLEDCQNHRIKVVWKANEKELLISLDGNNIIGLQKNIVADVFLGKPEVYWGFSSATGGGHNIHKICFEKLTFEALPIPNTFSAKKRKAIEKGDITSLDNVLFRSGSATLKKESDEELTKLVDLLKANPDHHLSIYGHTDAVGNEQTNAELSQKRAESIVDFLIKKGIDPTRLSAKGMGENYPIANNDNAAGRLKNRRVEIYLYRPIP